MIKKDYIEKEYPVIPIQSKIQKLFDIRFQNELVKANKDMRFDLVWSARLYDYLNDKSSKRFTEKLFEMVASNGELLIGNCFNTMCGGYMECFMNWTLIYRNIQEIREFAPDINPDEILEIKEFQFESFAFIEITKK